MDPITIIAFYQFTPVGSVADSISSMRETLQAFCEAAEIKGTILLATEGINATISGTRVAILQFQDLLKTLGFHDVVYKTSYATRHPFRRLKVKIKNEIITLCQPTVDVQQRTGEYVSPAAWNSLIQQENVCVVDTRNQYEVEQGTFIGAQSPHTETFQEFPAFVQQQLEPSRHKRVALFCTGGIRCEKASSYLLQQGFETVYQLEGGILNYLERIPPEDRLFQGECFVFDERRALDPRGC